MSKLFYGSINVTELINALNTGHSAFTKTDKGVVYGNINAWLNDEPDKYGNVFTVSLNAGKDSQDAKVYIANLKLSDGRPATGDDVQPDFSKIP